LETIRGLINYLSGRSSTQFYKPDERQRRRSRCLYAALSRKWSVTTNAQKL